MKYINVNILRERKNRPNEWSNNEYTFKTNETVKKGDIILVEFEYGKVKAKVSNVNVDEKTIPEYLNIKTYREYPNWKPSKENLHEKQFKCKVCQNWLFKVDELDGTCRSCFSKETDQILIIIKEISEKASSLFEEGKSNKDIAAILDVEPWAVTAAKRCWKKSKGLER